MKLKFNFLHMHAHPQTHTDISLVSNTPSPNELGSSSCLPRPSTQPPAYNTEFFYQITLVNSKDRTNKSRILYSSSKPLKFLSLDCWQNFVMLACFVCFQDLMLQWIIFCINEEKIKLILKNEKKIVLPFIEKYLSPTLLVSIIPHMPLTRGSAITRSLFCSLVCLSLNRHHTLLIQLHDTSWYLVGWVLPPYSSYIEIPWLSMVFCLCINFRSILSDLTWKAF